MNAWQAAVVVVVIVIGCGHPRHGTLRYDRGESGV